MLDRQVSNELKILALEMINNAGSGHSGSVLSSGDALYTLYTKHLVNSFDGYGSDNRDRFVLSNGHASAILYSILSGLGYIPMEELKRFRQFGGMLTGHPEIHIPGIDSATGPLGQGVANAVGMAIAETIIGAKFGEHNYTYCMVGDGCLQEGVALEALSVAGLYNLNKFILLYDKNNVTLDGKLSQSSKDDIVLKFKAMNFNVLECDGHNINQIDNAIKRAKTAKLRPTVIILNTIIGKDTSVAGSHASHGKVYTEEEIALLRKKLKVTSPKLDLSEEAKQFLENVKTDRKTKFDARIDKWSKHLLQNKLDGQYARWFSLTGRYKVKQNKKPMSTRVANGLVLNDISKTVENFVVLSADLSSSTKVKINDGGVYSAENRLGRNIALGIREHAMGAIANGIALYGGLFVATSTFLTFSNYMLPAMRMASIMDLPVMFTFSHSSVYETPDGVTHLPVEQLDQLRLMPNLTVFRPATINECVTAYDWYFANKKPLAVCLSRGDLPYFNKCENMDKGAYFITEDKANINIMASGAELRIAVEVKNLLKSNNIVANVISVPSLEVFEKQAKAYKNKILNKPLFVIESSTCVKFLKYTTEDRIFNVNEFGASGDEARLMEKYGYSAHQIAQKIQKTLK